MIESKQSKMDFQEKYNALSNSRRSSGPSTSSPVYATPDTSRVPSNGNAPTNMEVLHHKVEPQKHPNFSAVHENAFPTQSVGVQTGLNNNTRNRMHTFMYPSAERTFENVPNFTSQMPNQIFITPGPNSIVQNSNSPVPEVTPNVPMLRNTVPHQTFITPGPNSIVPEVKPNVPDQIFITSGPTPMMQRANLTAPKVKPTVPNPNPKLQKPTSGLPGPNSTPKKTNQPRPSQKRSNSKNNPSSNELENKSGNTKNVIYITLLIITIICSISGGCYSYYSKNKYDALEKQCDTLKNIQTKYGLLVESNILLKAEYDLLKDSNTTLEKKFGVQLQNIKTEYDLLKNKFDVLEEEKLQNIQKERDVQIENNHQIEEELNELQTKYDALEREHDSLKKERDTLENKFDVPEKDSNMEMENNHEQISVLEKEYVALQKEYDEFKVKYIVLESEKDLLQDKNDKLEKQYSTLEQMISSNNFQNNDKNVKENNASNTIQVQQEIEVNYQDTTQEMLKVQNNDYDTRLVELQSDHEDVIEEDDLSLVMNVEDKQLMVGNANPNKNIDQIEYDEQQIHYDHANIYAVSNVKVESSNTSIEEDLEENDSLPDSNISNVSEQIKKFDELILKTLQLDVKKYITKHLTENKKLTYSKWKGKISKDKIYQYAKVSEESDPKLAEYFRIEVEKQKLKKEQDTLQRLKLNINGYFATENKKPNHSEWMKKNENEKLRKQLPTNFRTQLDSYFVVELGKHQKAQEKKAEQEKIKAKEFELYKLYINQYLNTEDLPKDEKTFDKWKASDIFKEKLETSYDQLLADAKKNLEKIFNAEVENRNPNTRIKIKNMNKY